MREKVHHPATARELTQVLRVPREERTSFKRQLKTLVTDGALLQIRGNRFGLPEKMDLVVGRLQTNPSGFGFVVPEHAERSFAPSASSESSRARSKDTKTQGRQDIYIAASNLTEAMHGDRVVVRIERQS